MEMIFTAVLNCKRRQCCPIKEAWKRAERTALFNSRVPPTSSATFVARKVNIALQRPHISIDPNARANLLVTLWPY